MLHHRIVIILTLIPCFINDLLPEVHRVKHVEFSWTWHVHSGCFDEGRLFTHDVHFMFIERRYVRLDASLYLRLLLD